MTWKLPQNEEQWPECLSAYLDGEMEEEDRIALEAYLQTDPTRLDRFAGVPENRRLAARMAGRSSFTQRSFLSAGSNRRNVPNPENPGNRSSFPQ